jgi:hypothetical protein
MNKTCTASSSAVSGREGAGGGSVTRNDILSAKSTNSGPRTKKKNYVCGLVEFNVGGVYFSLVHLQFCLVYLQAAARREGAR